LRMRSKCSLYAREGNGKPQRNTHNNRIIHLDMQYMKLAISVVKILT